MACISCGVITSPWVWRSSSLCESAIRSPAELVRFLLLIAGHLHGRYVIEQWGLAELRALTNYARYLQLEFLAQVESAHIGIVHDVVGAALHQNLAGVNDVSTVSKPQRLAHIMVCDQHTNPAIGQMPHERLDVSDCDWVDAGKRFVEQHVTWPRRQSPRDFHAPTLAA